MRAALCCCLLALTVGLTLPASAAGSELIARDARDVRLAVNAKGQALLTYTQGGALRRVLVWGAIDARHPSRGQRQVAFRVDYSGGWGTYRRKVWQGFRNVCRPYRGPQLAWFQTGCTAPDGSHWAIQSWQRRLPNYGVHPTPDRAAWELRLSHWRGETAKLEIHANWAYRRFDHIFGRFTYRGRPVFGFASTPVGEPLDTYGRNLYVDTYNSAYGPGWQRENGFLTHTGTGMFCYGFFPHGNHPSGMGERYRATIIGPGVTPDVMWEGSPLGAYDRERDLALHEAQREFLAEDPLCKPV